MDVRRLVKVYNYVNNERRPKVNLKFLGVLAAFLLSGVALVTFGVYGLGDPAGHQAAANAAGPACPSKTEYVGVSTAELGQGAVDPRLPQQRRAQWERENPGADIQSETPVYAAGVQIGSRITFVPASC